MTNYFLHFAQEEYNLYFKNEAIKWKERILKWRDGGQKGLRPIKPRRQEKVSKFNEGELENLDQIPSHWKWIKIGQFATFTGSGSTPKGGRSTYLNEGIPFIRSQNVYPNQLKTDKIVFISLDIHEDMYRTHTRPFDVLINITGASIGRCAFIPESIPSANVNQHVCIVRVDSEYISYKYLTHYLNSPFAQIIIQKINSGATREALTLNQINNFPFPLCSIEEQEQIVELLEAKLSILEKEKENTQDRLRQFELLQHSILKKAFEGKLVEQDKNDEPVSGLLNSIKKEKEVYFLKQKELAKIKRAKMKNKEKKKALSILEVLKNSNRPISSKLVWQQSMHHDNIEEFYAELKKIENKIKEVRKGKESLLSIKA